jgi:hypothetical protein
LWLALDAAPRREQMPILERLVLTPLPVLERLRAVGRGGRGVLRDEILQMFG